MLEGKGLHDVSKGHGVRGTVLLFSTSTIFPNTAIVSGITIATSNERPMTEKEREREREREKKNRKIENKHGHHHLH